MSETHPLWQPFKQLTEEEWAAARVRPELRSRTLQVVAPDPAWPAAYAQVREALRAALGERLVAVAHVGSTSVPGLWAKPFIDVDVTVADSADEAAWLPPLEEAGFELRLREPNWEEHRLVTYADPDRDIDANVHVWSPGAVEPRRHLAFTRWLVDHPTDLALYADLKRLLASQPREMVHYSNAKAGLIYDIYERIFAADPEHPHDPRPRPMQDDATSS